MLRYLIHLTQILSSEQHLIEPYFIKVSISDIKDPLEKRYINHIPTSFTLEKEQVDKLIETAKQLLRDNPEYQKLLQSLNVNKKV